MQTVSPWPDDMRPNDVPVHSWNELTIDAPAEAIWAVLIRAADWPSFYRNSSEVRFAAGEGPDLQEGTVWSWRTFGVRVRTRVTVFEPHRCLMWRGDQPHVHACHAWVLQPEPNGGCRVITEETQRGVVPWLARSFLRPGLHKHHQRWLEGIAATAR